MKLLYVAKRRSARSFSTLATIRLLVGMRPALLRLIGYAWVELDLEDPRYVEPDDLFDYILLRLLDDPSSPYYRNEEVAEKMADEIALHVGSNFLMARLICNTLVILPKGVDTTTEDWKEHFPNTIGEAFDWRLTRFGADEPIVRALLLPLAYAPGAGWLEEDLWRPLAAALAGRGSDHDREEDRKRLLAQMGALMVQTTENGGAAYRLAHPALAEHLRQNHGMISLPPLQIRLIEQMASLESGKNSMQADGLLDIAWQDHSFRFVVEFKALSTPRSLEIALMEARSYAQTSKLLPLVIVPFLPEKSLELLEREGVSGIDLNGNGIVITPSFSVRRTGQPNRFPSSQPIQNVFRGNSSLLARCFLLQKEFFALKDVQKFALERLMTRNGIATEALQSKGTVSKVIHSLVEEKIVVRTANQIRLAAPDMLLERLRTNYVKSRGRRLEGKMALSMVEAWTRLQESGMRYVATGDGSTGRYRLLSGGEKLSLYVDDIQRATSLLEIKESRVFPNVELIEEESDPFYFDARVEGAVRWASPIQTWLELALAGPREREAAQLLEIALAKGEADALL